MCLEGAEEGERVIIWKYGIIRQETWKCNLGFEVVPSTRGYFGSKGLVYARQAARSNFTPSSSLALLLKPRSLTNSPSPLPFNYSETCFKLNTVLSWRCPLHVPLFLCTIVCMLMSLVVLIITSTLDSFVGCFFFYLTRVYSWASLGCCVFEQVAVSAVVNVIFILSIICWWMFTRSSRHFCWWLQAFQHKISFLRMLSRRNRFLLVSQLNPH